MADKLSDSIKSGELPSIQPNNEDLPDFPVDPSETDTDILITRPSSLAQIAQTQMIRSAIYPFGFTWRILSRTLTIIFVGLITLLFLWQVQAILPPFIIAIFLAALLDPTLRYMQKHGHSRVNSILFVYLLGLLVVALIVILIFPAVKGQIEELSANSTNYYSHIENAINAWMVKNASTLHIVGIRQVNLSQLLSQKSPAQEKITQTLQSLVVLVQSIASHFIWLVIIPVTGFFFMRDYAVMRARAIALFPEKHHDQIDRVSRSIVEVFSAYIRGLTKICLFYGLVILVIYSALGLRYALFLGLMAAAFYAIPLIGPWFVAITAGVLAYLEPHTILFVFHVPEHVIVYAIIIGLSAILAQNVFDQLLYPKQVGELVGLHPAVTMFALLSGSTLLGIAGMLIAVPVAASIQIVLVSLFPKLKQQPPAKLLDPPMPIA